MAILEDLDIRASDLLQANGIIWVEGPSDRVYIKKWLEIFTDCQFEEGRDYQFLCYAGRLLSHYGAFGDEDNIENFINVLLTNRNSAIVIDSDRLKPRAQINQTKQRVRDEFEKNKKFCWITKGKEIENYISKEAIKDAYGKCPRNQCGQYQLFPQYINNQCSGFKNQKTFFAHRVTETMTKDNSKGILDLEEQIKRLHSEIKKWNSID